MIECKNYGENKSLDKFNIEKALKDGEAREKWRYRTMAIVVQAPKTKESKSKFYENLDDETKKISLNCCNFRKTL